MVLREVFKRSALVLPNSLRQSSIDNIFGDIYQILSPLKHLVEAIVLIVGGSKFIYETIFLDFLNFLNVPFQFFKCSLKSLEVFCDAPPCLTVLVQLMRRYPESLCLQVEDECLNLLVRKLCILHNGVISFLECGPLAVRLLDNLYDFMLWVVRMLAYVQAIYAICWLGYMIEACPLFALVEDPLSFVARAQLGARLRLPLSQLLICCHINYYSLYFI